INIEHIGLVNIVAQKLIIKELIQQQANANAITAEVMQLLDNDSYRNTMVQELAQIKAKLGKSGGSAAIADLAIEMMSSATHKNTSAA
ncbi:MAG: hypothetical protein HRU21_12030, partial [Pseudomonadales bacterium]|nr:hypothetical protein [Pseudomonadales bacterium]